jgi:hypothetical protein
LFGNLKRPNRLRRRWEDNIKMDAKAIMRENVDLIHPEQNIVQWTAVVNA